MLSNDIIYKFDYITIFSSVLLTFLSMKLKEIFVIRERASYYPLRLK